MQATLELDDQMFRRPCRLQKTVAELKHLRQVRDHIDDRVLRLEWHLKHNAAAMSPASLQRYSEDLETLREERDDVKSRHSSKVQEHHETFHPIWGQLMKTGHQASQLAYQIERFACLYTSHVSNLAFYSPDNSYQSRLDHMAHEDVMMEELAEAFEDDRMKRASSGPLSSS